MGYIAGGFDNRTTENSLSCIGRKVIRFSFSIGIVCSGSLMLFGRWILTRCRVSNSTSSPRTGPMLTNRKDQEVKYEPISFFCYRQIPLLSLFICPFTLFSTKLSAFALGEERTFLNSMLILLLLVATVDMFLLLWESLQRIQFDPALRKARARRVFPYSLPIDYYSRHVLINWLDVRIPALIITKAGTRGSRLRIQREDPIPSY